MPKPNGQDDDQQPKPTPNLDQIHDIETNRLENEDDDDSDDDADDSQGDDSNNNDDDAAGDDADDSADDGDGGDAGDGDGSDDDSDDDADGDDADGGDDAGAGDDAPVVPAPNATPAPDKPAAKLDTDIKKPGEGKVAIKSLDGETYYFNNTDEVPADFEPATYKDFMVGTKELYKKEAADEKATADAEVKAQEDARVEATNKLQESWENDASDLVRKGIMPNKPDELEKEKEKVYDYIDKELKAGNPITSFKQAYKSMKYDEEQAAKVERQKGKNDAKKKRGGIIQPGTGGSAPNTGNTKGKTIQAPPAGAGLDAVHNNIMENLENGS